MEELQIPPTLKNVISEALLEHGLSKPPRGTPWEKQMDVLEQRKRYEMECLLQTVLTKLSPYADDLRDELTQSAVRERDHLMRLLRPQQ